MLQYVAHCGQMFVAGKARCLSYIGEVQFRTDFPNVAFLSEDVLLFFTVRSKSWVCRRLFAGWDCGFESRRQHGCVLCVRPISCPDESYRVCRV